MSDRTAVESTVLDILEDVLNASEDELRAQPVLAAHDWDSLSQLEVLAQLESRLAITLDLRAYQAAREVDDLVGLVAGLVDAARALPTTVQS
ncbi:MAG: acyl carrier protein [Frankiaceae bacterium]